MGKRIDTAYSDGILSEEDYAQLGEELDKYIDEAAYSVEYKRCAQIISRNNTFGNQPGISQRIQNLLFRIAHSYLGIYIIFIVIQILFHHTRRHTAVKRHSQSIQKFQFIHCIRCCQLTFLKLNQV